MIANNRKQENYDPRSKNQTDQDLLQRRKVLDLLPLHARKKIEQAMIDYPAGYVNILSDRSVFFSSRGLLYTGSALAYEGDFHY
jgi:hypothetical protein